jgi:oxaloacetate decarboxylase alpha subunit
MDLKEIEELAGLLNEFPVTEILIQSKGKKAHLIKGAFERTAPLVSVDTESRVETQDAPPIPRTEHEDFDPTYVLTSKLVGIFHHTKPTVRVGAVIQSGQTIGNVESMKVLNEVVAETGGQVVEVLVEEGAPIDYGAELFRILPS